MLAKPSRSGRQLIRRAATTIVLQRHCGLRPWGSPQAALILTMPAMLLHVAVPVGHGVSASKVTKRVLFTRFSKPIP